MFLDDDDSDNESEAESNNQIDDLQDSNEAFCEVDYDSEENEIEIGKLHKQVVQDFLEIIYF